MVFIFFNYISFTIVLIGTILQSALLIHRLILRHKYLQLDTSKFSLKDLNFWLHIYMFNTFLSGLLWGLSYSVISNVPEHYYYLLYGTSIGITSAGLISLGSIPKIFYAFATPLMGLSLIWIFSHSDTFHLFIGFATLIGVVYYVAFSFRYAKSTIQSYLDKEIIKENVTQLQEVQTALIDEKSKLAHQANYDALTGLPNRLLFTDRLEQALLKAERQDTKVALLFLDLDHFKEINDSFGHQVGDQVLQEITKILLQNVRAEDSIARLGGDEFTIIMDDVKDTLGVSHLAQKIIDALNQKIKIGTNEFYVSTSIGISLFPNDGKKCVDLIKYADSAMYRAKDEGRNTYQFYKQEMTELALQRVMMESQLREAIKNEEFVVYYQPQVDAKAEKLIGMEALVRWQHPSLGMIPPFKFIPIAESTGLIVELDRYVMKTAMTQLATWYKQGYNPGVLAMNLAIKQLQKEDFLDVFKNLITETECQAQWLELEVTEGQIMTNPQDAIVILQKISNLEIELAIDDFGTGYSSLSYLKKLPINKLKIDQSFVNDLPHDKEDAAIAKAVIALAKSLNLRVIAEGVETIEQKDFLVDNECVNIQGYLYSKPVPAEEFEKLLTDNILSQKDKSLV